MITEEKLHSILYIDDEEHNLTSFHSTYRRDYNIHLATSGQMGLEIMKNNDIQLVITDQRMPEMTGIEFLERILPHYPDCIRIVMTGYSDMEAIIQAINKGRIYHYIAKPWNRDELKITIDRALEVFSLKQQNRNLIADLKEANRNLEQKVVERTKQIEQQKVNITDSIHYASRIQNALLPPVDELNRLLPSYFIVNKPKDIVSGDYYWVSTRDDMVLIALADCTGHGVPGAFMSIMGINLLNEIVNKAETIIAGEILNELRDHLVKSLRQKGDKDETKDGMEMALCVIDFSTNMLQYSGAFRPMYFFRNGELNIIKGDKMPIGIYHEQQVSFSNREVQFEENDMIYLFTDGYVDQIGGPGRKTFRSKQFKKLLVDIHLMPMDEQKAILEKEYDAWRRGIEQIDDIMVMGIRFANT